MTSPARSTVHPTSFDPLLTPSSSEPTSATLPSTNTAVDTPTTPLSFKKRSAVIPGPAVRARDGLLNLLSSSPKDSQIDQISSLELGTQAGDQPSAGNGLPGSNSRVGRPDKIDLPPPGPFRTISQDSQILNDRARDHDQVPEEEDEEELRSDDDRSRTSSPSYSKRKTSVSGSHFGPNRAMFRSSVVGTRGARKSFGAISGTSRLANWRDAPLRDPMAFDDDDEAGGGGVGGLGKGRDNDLGVEEEEMPMEKEITPLPKIALIVLCICMFGEFLSASLSSPFLYFMIEGFGVGQGPNGGGEATVGFWTGVVSSVFFLSQFLTSLLWVSVAEKHGRRSVLFASLLGNGITLMLFGTSKNLGTAISVRLGMGLFNGAVGVARSAVQAITDSTNESKAFTYMGLSWGLGGIVGSIIGGLAESPVKNHPRFFGNSVLFAEYPYLLPCLIAGSVTTFGALLSLCLNPDGGPRTGSIKLPSEKDMERAARSFSSIAKSSIRRVITVLRNWQHPIRLDDRAAAPQDSPVSLHVSPNAAQREPLLSPGAAASTSNYHGGGMLSPSLAETNERGSVMAGRRASNRFSGSAYGYGRLGPGSEAGMRMPSQRRFTGRSAHRAMSVATSNAYAPDYDFDRGDFSFAQRLLMANEQAVFSISDLWVANATREADDQYSQVEYEESVFEDEESRLGGRTGTNAGRTRASEASGDNDSRLDVDDSQFSLSNEPDFVGYGTAPPSMEDIRGQARYQDENTGHYPKSPGSEALGVPIRFRAQDRSPSRGGAGGGERWASPARNVSYGNGLTQRLRRGSMASSAAGGGRPVSIFANTGLDDETLVQSTQHAPPPGSLGGKAGDEYGAGGGFDPMAPIPEGRPASIVEYDEEGDSESIDIKPDTTSLIRQLPLSMIGQYSLLALHGCTCDQIFLSFLVTPVPSGGLGLKASNYAMLVACMFFFTMVWQFRLYPFVGPPHGSLSHLAMFRLGLIMYIPVYVLFPELRGLLREDSNGFVMFGMVLLSALRYLANTCSYTAVMVLVNAMSPPHLVPLANGLAQSSVSLARFIGPLSGGTIWAASIADGPNAHAWPFNYAFPFIVIACICFLGFLHSFRIH